MPATTAVAVVDLGWGDASKGSVTDWLARTTPDPIVVRFNGACQAAHNVVTPDGRHHTFASFGSGTFVPTALTYLAEEVIVNPVAVFTEEAHLRAVGVSDGLARLFINGDCKLATTWHKALNRMRETARGNDVHGTCGHGIGETMSAHIDRPDLTVRFGSPSRNALLELRDHLRTLAVDIDPHSTELRFFDSEGLFEDYWQAWKDLSTYVTTVDETWIDQDRNLIFEGAQGVLLDETYGFHPHTTWSTCTYQNAVTALRNAGLELPLTRLGVTRTYQTRHGAGPFPTEDPAWHLALPERHNNESGLQGAWRVGPADLTLTRYAVDVVGGIDGLVVTHCDMAAADWKVAVGYIHETQPWPPAIATMAGKTCSRIYKTATPTLEGQEWLGRWLSEVTPVYVNVPVSEYPNWLSEKLGRPLFATSHGPTANDKTFHLRRVT